MPEKPTLKRSMNLLILTFYGLGTIIGAGIYVLIWLAINFARNNLKHVKNKVISLI